MFSWPNNGGGVDGNNQLGFAKFKENPFTPSSSAVFGTTKSSSSVSTAALPNPPAANTTGNVGFGSGLFGTKTAIYGPPFPVATQAHPCQSSTRDISSSACSPFSSGNYASNSSTVSQFVFPPSAPPFPFEGQHSSGWTPFSSSAQPFGVASSYNSSPFGTKSPFGGPAFPTFNSAFGSSTTLHTGNQLFGTNPTCAFHQPSNSVPSSSLFLTPRSFDNVSSTKGSQSGISSSPAVSQLGGQQLCGWSPFSSGISSSVSPAFGVPFSSSTTPFGVQHSSGWSPVSSGISSSPTVSPAFGVPSSSSTTPFGVQHSSGWSPFSSGISSSVSPAFGVPSSSSTTPFGVQYSSGWSPVSSGISSSVSPAFGVPFSCVQHCTSVSSATTSPFETKLPFGTSSTGPFTRSLAQDNTPANNVSVFVPFKGSNLGISDIQGTIKCSYGATLELDNYKLVSVSAMPFYKEKSHEELRLEDYHQLTRRTGSSIINTNSKSSNQHNTSANNVSVFAPFTNSDPGRSGFQGTKWSCETSPVEGWYAIGAESSSSFPVINISIPLSPSLASTSSSSSTGAIPGFSFPNPSAFESLHLSIERRFLGDLLATPQTTIPVPTSGTIPPFNYNATVSEDDMAMIPKLKCPEYYTEPSVHDLAANELKRPGFCSQVKDFVIGKRGYGSVKFLGETDVRNLDLESMVQFDIREVRFCMDKKAKPPVGQGLNKAAEITLLNVNCIDKNTGKEYIDGPEVDKYMQLLVRKTAEQGAEFVSFNPAKGEWKFKVQHF